MKYGKTLPATGFDAVPIFHLRPMRVELDGQTSPRAARPSRTTVAIAEHEGWGVARARVVKTSNSRQVGLDTERGQVGTRRDEVSDGETGRTADGEVVHGGEGPD